MVGQNISNILAKQTTTTTTTTTTLLYYYMFIGYISLENHKT